MRKLARHSYVYGTDAGEEEEEEETDGRTGERRKEKRQAEEPMLRRPGGHRWAASLRKRLQDGVHLLCHGCQRKLKLLLRREKRWETAGEEK